MDRDHEGNKLLYIVFVAKDSCKYLRSISSGPVTSTYENTPNEEYEQRIVHRR